MGLRARLAKAQAQKDAPTGTMRVAFLNEQGTALPVQHGWVKRASEGAAIGQPLTERGLPVRSVV